ncbi:MAG TPA: DUF3293 domain-containing protein [Gemmatimonadaceae bacterium]|nr:DUF3293 domain-containing protein [Gemmatimonadaceae bacterium]
MKSTPDSHDPDWPRYAETVLIFSTVPPLEIDLRAVVTAEAALALAAAGLEAPFAVITAFDPRGENLSAGENRHRQRRLESRITENGYEFTTVDCCSPDRSHCECSVAVTMPRDEALALARELEQVAIFWFDGRSFWIMGAILETDPLMLPRSS